MLRAHVAAGLDPAAFWRLTPREWLVLMQGVEDHHERERVIATTSAWIGARADEKGLKSWLAERPSQPRAPLTPEATDRMLKHTAAGLPEITMEVYLNMRGQSR